MFREGWLLNWRPWTTRKALSKSEQRVIYWAKMTLKLYTMVECRFCSKGDILFHITDSGGNPEGDGFGSASKQLLLQWWQATPYGVNPEVMALDLLQYSSCSIGVKILHMEAIPKVMALDLLQYSSGCCYLYVYIV